MIVARELLADTGSLFVQIGQENLHRVRDVLDEVFGSANSLGLIAFATTGGQSAELLGNVFDFLLWYGKDVGKAKYRQLYNEKGLRRGGGWAHSRIEFSDGRRENVGVDEVEKRLASGEDVRPYSLDGTASQGATASGSEPYTFQAQRFDLPPNSHWKTTTAGLNRLVSAGRLESSVNSIRYVRFIDDFPVQPITNIWEDTNRPGYIDAKRYAVQTNLKVVERCMLMTTDAGDLVLDPTCGSGTTAYVGEQWGRRWITIDTSRVAIAIARQRLLTAKYEYYKLKDEVAGIAHGFRCKTVPHVGLKSIAQNSTLDPIFAKHEPILETKLAAANTALKTVSDRLRNNLRAKLVLKQKREGKKAITDADRRRWELPAKDKDWQHWEVPFDTDPDYPADLKKAVEGYRAAWRAKMDEVNACIAANAEQEELVDQPEVDRKITRVSGPFTVEAVQPPEMSLGDAIEVNTGQFAGEPEELGETFVIREVQMGESAQNIEAYLAKMVDLLKMDGVRFPDNKHMKFTRLDPIYASGSSAGIHAEGR